MIRSIESAIWSYIFSRVDMRITPHIPHRTRRAAFPHRAPYKTNYSTTILHTLGIKIAHVHSYGSNKNGDCEHGQISYNF